MKRMICQNFTKLPRKSISVNVLTEEGRLEAGWRVRAIPASREPAH